MKAITVGELKRLLTNMPDDLPIRLEGCDCIGPCSGAELSEIAEYKTGERVVVQTVLLKRNDRLTLT